MARVGEGEQVVIPILEDTEQGTVHLGVVATVEEIAEGEDGMSYRIGGRWIHERDTRYLPKR